MEMTPKREGYAWKIIRLIVGPAIVAAVFVMGWSWSHSIIQGVEHNFYIVFMAVGSLFLTTGLFGIFRVRADRKPGAPARSGASKVARFGAAVVLAALLTGAEYFAGRVINIRAAEKSTFEGARAMNSAGAWSSWRYFLRHNHEAPLVQTYDDAAARERFEKCYATSLLMDDDHQVLHQLKVRFDQQAGGAADYEASTWWLDTFTPIREHARFSGIAYDDARFKEAASAGTTGDLRSYRLEFPMGRHLDETKALLQAKYRDAEKKYDELVAAKKANPASAAGVRSLLAWLRDNDVDSRAVAVCYLPVAGLDAAKLEDTVRASFKPKEVVPVSPSFTTESNQKRQYAITFDMDKAFRAVVGSLVSLVEAKAEETRKQARFLVGYEIFPTGSIYSPVKEDALPMSQRTLYVGIGLKFDCTIQAPTAGKALEEDLKQGHCFSLTAKPAPNFTALGDKSGLSPGAVYSAMASTAFGNFRDELIRSYGFEPPQ